MCVYVSTNHTYNGCSVLMTAISSVLNLIRSIFSLSSFHFTYKIWSLLDKSPTILISKEKKTAVSLRNCVCCGVFIDLYSHRFQTSLSRSFGCASSSQLFAAVWKSNKRHRSNLYTLHSHTPSPTVVYTLPLVQLFVCINYTNKLHLPFNSEQFCKRMHMANGSTFKCFILIKIENKTIEICSMDIFDLMTKTTTE